MTSRGLAKPKRLVDKGLLKYIRQLNCLVCGVSPSDPAHIKSRGAGGPDAMFNLMPLCRTHHTQSHRLGWASFASRYPVIRAYLRLLEWEIGENGKLTHPQLCEGTP